MKLDGGSLAAVDDAGVTRVAILGNLALGDIDGDNLDELVLGGMYERQSCNAFEYVVMALDDAAHRLADMGSAVIETSIDGCSFAEKTIEETHVGVADLEDDGALEVYVNGLIFADWRTGVWTPRDEILGWWPVYTEHFHSAKTSAMIAADFTGDGRDDIGHTSGDRNNVEIWGIEESMDDLHRLRRIAVTNPSSSWPRSPILLPVDIDLDTTVMEFVSHEYLMTEPVVMAALDAAPGRTGIGQNTDACTTRYGNGDSNSVGTELGLNFTAGVLVGTEFQWYGNGWDVESRLSIEYGHVWTTNYTVETSLSYETGPLEDTVICTIVPYDHYTYRVVSDPNPDAVGSRVEVSLPRSPITLQVEREFYNSSVGRNALKVDDSVFQHRAGDIRSYPSKPMKDELLNRWHGLQTPGTASCGLGSGSTTQEIVVSQESGHEDFLNTSFELEVNTLVAGIKLGISVGFGFDATWTRSIGEQTTYSGTVGAIDAAHFPEHGFQFGLFTYRQTHATTGQDFEVVQYWVE
jgi:hypothetical protein